MSSAGDNGRWPHARQAEATIVRAITLLAEAKGESWVNKAPIFNMIKRLAPTAR